MKTPSFPMENVPNNGTSTSPKETPTLPMEQAQNSPNETKVPKPTFPLESTPRAKTVSQEQKPKSSIRNDGQKRSKDAPKDAELRADRRKEVFTILERTGAFSRPSRKLIREIAEKYTTSERHIYKDIDYFYEKIGKQAPDVGAIARQSIAGMKSALVRSSELMNSTDPKVAAMGVRLLSGCIIDMCVVLEKYGYKEIMTPELIMDTEQTTRPTQIIFFEQNTVNLQQNNIVKEVSNDSHKPI